MHRFAALALFSLFGLWSAALAAPVKFEIPAQAAPAALMAFAKQARVEVVFSADDLKTVRANEVIGEFEPEAALGVLLKDTGFAASRTSGGKFIVKAVAAPATTGAVKGSLVGEGGRGLAGVLVTVRETSQSAETDRFGEYVFPKLAAGTYVLAANAPGYQPLHITDVQVRAGRELTLGKEEMRRAKEGPLALEPFVVRADTVTELDPYEVTGSKVKPFSTPNVDIPRTANDAQPYYIFDARTLNSSGAANLEDFLKKRLTMNTVGLTSSQTSAAFAASVSLGNTSTINLRGLGADKTLILVNGRRVPGPMSFLSEFQPDINGLPLSAIDRVEVLPTSASGIYGSSALGGVVNIILKRDFAGGEIRANYANTFDTDAPTRTLSATVGTSLGAKTKLMLTGQWSETGTLLIQDRRSILDANIARVKANNPTFLYSTAGPALGVLTNIAASPSGNLVLDNNTNLGSPITFVPAGTAPGTPAATLAAGLLANAGRYDLNFPYSKQHPYGLLRPIGAEPEVKSFQANLRHELRPWLELFAEFRYASNHADAVFDPTGAGSLTVPATSPINPFIGAVRVRVPVSISDPSVITDSVTRSIVTGFNAKLPHDWVVQGDYTWSSQYLSTFSSVFDGAAVTAAFNSGALNPFIDTQQFGIDLDRYVLRIYSISKTNIDDFVLRGAGPLPALPWGVPRLATGLGYRRSTMPDNRASTDLQVFTYFPRWSIAQHAYAELSIPLVKEKRFRFIHSLEAQVSGRMEQFKVKTGTPSIFYLRSNPTQPVAGTPSIGGVPFFGEDDYTQTNYTLALKYQPVRDIIIRASMASAFIPPTPAQLLENPTTVTTTISSDPKDPTVTGTKQIPAVSGGNPDLKPQNSESLNAGIVWSPAEGWFKNFRLDVEYYKIRQEDFISSLTAQTLVNSESLFPDRITRDAAGHITRINTRLLNLFMRENSGWDLTADYYLKSRWGTFTLHGQHSTILTLKTQYTFQVPPYNGAGYPNDSNGAVKHKTNATVGWERGNWLVNWTAQYTGSYYQVGSPGGPSSMQNANGGVFVNGSLTAQGGFVIPSQTYHDVVVEYSFGKSGEGSGWRRRWLGDLSIMVGVKNVFDKLPPFDAQQSSNFYLSAYGDIRLRSYWLNVRKKF